MKKYLIGLIICLQTFSLYCQESKVFNGEFQEGTAEYEFYTNENYDIIYNGFFHYYGEKYIVLGNYKENLPEGEWIIKADNKVYSNWQSKIQTNTFVKGSYSNGLLDGTWKYKNSFLLPDWKTGEFNQEKEADTDISEASFSNNIFVGKITYSRNFPNIEITGSFDSEGLMSGTWTYKKDYEEDIIKYKKGVAYWRLIRTLPTGEKTLFIDSTKFVDDFWENYDAINMVSFIDDKVYYAQKIKVDSKNRVSNSSLDLTNLEIRTNRGTYDNPAIAIWQNVNVKVYQSYRATNPLYYGIRDSKSPNAYKIVIKECSYSSTNNNFISNNSCTKALNILTQKKETEKKNKESFLKAKSLEESLENKIKKVEESSTKTSLKLESIKPIYSQNYNASLQYLKKQFSSQLSEVQFSENYTIWTEIEEGYYSSLKKIKSNVSDYEKFHEIITTGLKNDDKKLLKLLKSETEISVIIGNILSYNN